jgi:hypothetical protein
MKKLFLFLAMMMLSAAGFAQSATIPGSNLTWELSGGTLTIGGTGAMPNFSIQSPWYSSRPSITTVVIGEGVTSVGNYAFFICDNLTSVTIPGSVTTIGDNAFDVCSKLTSVTLGKDVTRIGDDAFSNCGLTSVTIPDKVISLGSRAFASCRSLTAVTIPESVTSIGDEVFYDCAKLTAITVENDNAYYSSEDGVLFNKDQSILYCYPGGKSGDSYTVAAGVSIREKALIGCTGLKAIEVASNHADYASEDGVLFTKDKTALIAYPGGKGGNYMVPDGVKSIREHAFYYCPTLYSVIISNSVESIGASAFYNSTGLASVTIGSSVTSIERSAFYYCYALTSVVNLNPTPQNITAPNNIFSSNVSQITLYVPAGSVSAYKAAAGWNDVKAIYAIGTQACGENVTWSFSDGTLTISGTGAMTDMRIGSNNLALQYASQITSVVIEEGVTHIGSAAFCEYYGNITSVTIPASVETIGERAFNYCRSLTSVTIPKSVTSIGQYAFAECSKLADVTVGWAMPLTVPGNIFAASMAFTLHVPAGTKSSYQTATGWNGFKEYVEDGEPTGPGTGGPTGPLTWSLSSDGTLTISGTGAMPDYAIYGSAVPPWEAYESSVTAVVIENDVTNVGNCAFYWCSNLTSVTLGRVTAIGEYAFTGCGLTSVTLPGSVTTIRKSAFSNCRMTSVTVPAGVTTIESSAFGGDNLTSIEVEAGNAYYYSADGVLFIRDGNRLLLYPQGKAGVYTIPANVTGIEEWAFTSCSGLTSVNIPAGVTTIENGSFGACEGLTDVTVAWAEPAEVTVNVQAFTHSPISTATLHVPAGTKSKYETAAVWKDFGTIVEDGEPTGPVTGGTIPPLAWSLSSDGTLTISGTGAMPDYGGVNTPWHSLSSSITAVVIGEGVTHIGNYAFGEHYGNITSVTISAGVKTIGMYAFYGCGLTSVTIPATVTAIEGGAFFWCTGLTDVTVGWATPLTILDYTFASPSLSTATLHVPAGTKASYQAAIGWNGFKEYVEDGEPAGPVTNGTTGPLKWSLSSDGTLTISGKGAMPNYMGVDAVPWYSLHSSITTVVIDEGVTHIGDWAFQEYYYNITSVTIPGSVTTIGERAFANCLSLTSVTIPANVTTIGEFAFNHCSGLTSITIPGKVTTIERGAFYGCSGLTSVSIPGSVTSIGTDAFRGCSGLTSVIIPGSVITIGVSAFYDCSGLTSITIPDKVTTIGEGAFYGCFGLTDVTVAWANPATVTLGAGVFDTSISTATLHVPAGRKSEYEASAVWKDFGTIVDDGEPAGPVTNGTTGSLKWLLSSDGTLIISGKGAMPDYGGVYNIPWYSLTYSITAVVIEEGVTHIGGWAFGGHYDNITSVTIPASVGTIGEDAFAGCTGLTSVTIPASVTMIGEYAFAWCTGLTDVTVEWATPLTVPTNIFEGSLSASTTLHVPAGKKALYQTATGWSLFKVFIEDGEPAGPLKWSLSADGTLTISGIGAMPDYTSNISATPWYAYRSSITTVVIENGVTHIGGGAFMSYENLTSVTIPGSVKTIGMYAFSYCGLTSVTIHGKVTTIGAHAFASCYGLTSITVETGNVYYYSTDGVLFAMDGNKLLQYPGGKAGTHYAIPANVTTIGVAAFSYCSLTSVTIPASVTTIGENAFGLCSLTSVTIPASVTTIGEGAFTGCNKLTDVTVGWATPPLIPDGYRFFGVPLSAATLRVPAGTKVLYEQAPEWKDFGTIVEYGDAPNLSVSPSTLDFAVGGGTQNLTVTANTGWTAAGSASWVTVSPASGSSDGTITVTAAANGGNARTATVTISGGGLTRTVTITQAAGEQDITVDPVPPSDGAPGYLILRLGIPTDDALSGTFLVILPPGMNLDLIGTVLLGSLADRYELRVTPVSANSWLLEIRSQASLRSVPETAERDIVRIAWTTDETVPAGSYEIKISNLEITLGGNTVIRRDEIRVSVTVATGTEVVEASQVWFHGDLLHVRTPVAERTEVYSVAGQLLHRAWKDAGEAVFDLNGLPHGGVLIVRGSSGWVKKIVR